MSVENKARARRAARAVRFISGCGQQQRKVRDNADGMSQGSDGDVGKTMPALPLRSASLHAPSQEGWPGLE